MAASLTPCEGFISAEPASLAPAELAACRRLGPLLILPVTASLLISTWLLMGCAAAPADSSGWDYTATPVDPQGDGGDDDGPVEPTLPPETADAFYRTLPAATNTYVFVVNPERDTVSKINANNRAVYTLPVGRHPTQVLVGAENPGRAVVLNEGDATVTILEAATDSLTTLSIHKDTNYLQLRSDGLYGITWFNSQVEDADLSVNGARSYSSISVVFTGDGQNAATSTPLAVALNPRDATFVPGKDQALVLCDDTLAQVNLSPKPTYRLIALTSNVDENLQVAELKVGPDGRFAFLRLANRAQLVVVDLEAPSPEEAVSRIDLPAVPSDMDLASENLIVVNRADRQLEVYSAVDPAQEPRVIGTPTNQLVGAVAVAPEINKAILYTTLTEADIHNTDEEGTPLNRFSVWDLTTDAIRVYELVKPVARVSLNHNPAAEVATFVHDGDASSELEVFDKKEAFSNFYFGDGLVVPTALSAPVRAWADTPDGAVEYLILEDDLHVLTVDYTSRQVYALPIQSRPVFVGILTGTSTGYVSQEHELGRISFVEPDSLTVTTITGFELNAQL